MLEPVDQTKVTALKPGSHFRDRYTIVRRLGGGGMGEVYLAQDITNPDFYVALKVIHPGVINTPSTRERFRNEIIAAYKISHPNIIQAYEYFDGGEMQAYAMEYVSGGDLLTRIKREPVSPVQAAGYLRQIAGALQTIHTAGIVHRDLKPENILLTHDDQVKIADFGVARLRGAQTLTQAGAMVGTPKYLAPEYIEAGECDHRGDIYALGVMGYELVAGTSPFPVDSRELLLVRRGTLKIPPLLKLAPHCPAELAFIIEKAMCPNLARRYQSAADLGRDLERFERGEPLVPEERTPTFTPPAVKAAPQHHFSSWRVAGAGSALALFCALIVVMARPVFFGALPSPLKRDGEAAPAESKFNAASFGDRLLRLAELERAFHAAAPNAPGGPGVTDERGNVSPDRVNARIAWLEEALNNSR